MQVPACRPLQRDHDLTDLLIAFEISVGIYHLAKRKYAVYLWLERPVSEAIVNIPLHPFEPFWSFGLSQKVEAQRNTLPYAGHGVWRRLSGQHSIKEDGSLERCCLREHIHVIAAYRIKDDTSEFALSNLVDTCR